MGNTVKTYIKNGLTQNEQRDKIKEEKPINSENQKKPSGKTQYFFF